MTASSIYDGWDIRREVDLDVHLELDRNRFRCGIVSSDLLGHELSAWVKSNSDPNTQSDEEFGDSDDEMHIQLKVQAKRKHGQRKDAKIKFKVSVRIPIPDHHYVREDSESDPWYGLKGEEREKVKDEHAWTYEHPEILESPGRWKMKLLYGHKLESRYLDYDKESHIEVKITVVECKNVFPELDYGSWSSNKKTSKAYDTGLLDIVVEERTQTGRNTQTRMYYRANRMALTMFSPVFKKQLFNDGKPNKIDRLVVTNEDSIPSVLSWMSPARLLSSNSESLVESAKRLEMESLRLDAVCAYLKDSSVKDKDKKREMGKKEGLTDEEIKRVIVKTKMVEFFESDNEDEIPSKDRFFNLYMKELSKSGKGLVYNLKDEDEYDSEEEKDEVDFGIKDLLDEELDNDIIMQTSRMRTLMTGNGVSKTGKGEYDQEEDEDDYGMDDWLNDDLDDIPMLKEELRELFVEKNRRLARRLALIRAANGDMEEDEEEKKEKGEDEEEKEDKDEVYIKDLSDEELSKYIAYHSTVLSELYDEHNKRLARLLEENKNANEDMEEEDDGE